MSVSALGEGSIASIFVPYLPSLAQEFSALIFHPSLILALLATYYPQTAPTSLDTVVDTSSCFLPSNHWKKKHSFTIGTAMLAVR